MSTKRSVVTAMLVGASLCCGACECERSRALKAFDSFMGFSRGREEARDREQPSFTVRSRREAFARGRSRAIVHIEVDPRSTHEQIAAALRDACHDPGLARNVSALKVIAWPGKLRSLVGPAGEGVFARDGHGWEGSGVGFERIEVKLPTGDQLRKRDLSLPTEEQYLHALGVDNGLVRGKSLEAAVAITARRHGVGVQTIQAAVDKLQALYGVSSAPSRPQE